MMKFTFEEQGERRDYAITGTVVRIGRDPSGEIVTGNRSVSKQHVTCTREDAGWVARDGGSANGMFVNGLRATEAVLRPGDVLRAGTFELTFANAETAAAGPSYRTTPADDGTVVDMAFAPTVGPSAASAAQVFAVAAPPPPPFAALALPVPPPLGAVATLPMPPAPPRAMAAGTVLARLAISRGMPPRSFELRAGGTLVLGTHEACDAVLAGEGISRRHAELFPRGKDWVVRDLGSKNGTYVNGRKVTERVLGHGESIAIGSVQFAFSLAEGAVRSGATSPARRQRLALAAAAAVVVLAGAFAVVPSRQAPPVAEPEPPRPTVDSSLAFQRALEAYARALTARFVDPSITGEADRLLRAVSADMPASHPDRRVVSTLASLLVECRNRQPSYTEMNWRQLEASALELRAFPTAGRLAGSILEWARAEHGHRGHVGDGMDYERAGKLAEAYAAFQKIPADSVYASTATARLSDLKDRLLERTARTAQAMAAGGDFQSVLDQVNALLNLLAGRHQDAVVTLSPIKREAERFLRYQVSLRQAELAFAGGKSDEARTKIGEIDLGAPESILRKAAALREQIDVQETLADAQRHYDSGNGQRALEILERQSAASLVELRARVQKVIDLTREAQQLAARQMEDRAQVQWGQILTLEPSETNEYHRQAKRAFGHGPDALAKANALHERGRQALADGEMKEARLRFEEAKEAFPNHAPSLKSVESFLREKQLAFNLDLAAFKEGKLTLETIIPRFRQTLEFLHSGDNIYDMYRRELERLEALAGTK